MITVDDTNSSNGYSSSNYKALNSRATNDELSSLEKKQNYEKRLLMYFSQQIREKGMTRDYKALFKTAKLALLVDIHSPEDLYLLQVFANEKISNIIQQQNNDIHKLREEIIEILGIHRNP